MVNFLFGYKEERINLSKLFKDKTVIIDTYARCNLSLEEKEIESKTPDVVEFFKDNGCTVIVIAHTNYYAGKTAEPDVDKVFANHTACRLHLHRDVSLDKRSGKEKDIIYLEIEKLRGCKQNIIQDWMRQPLEDLKLANNYD